MGDNTAQQMELAQRKLAALRSMLRPILARGLIVAYSGGVDSSFLLWAAQTERQSSGGRLLAVTAVSASMAQCERADAASFAAALGVEHHCEESAEFNNPDYVKNDLTRCYHCKTELFRISHGLGSKQGFEFVAYGYNASDRGDFRPGHAAATEQNILAPLDEVDLSKDEIRSLMATFGLPLAQKPASPCLSSRLMTGVPVTPEKLREIEDLEAIVRQGGINVFRMRLHEYPGGKWLRLEVAVDELPNVLPLREELLREGRARGFSWVTLDLAGYRMGGSVALTH
jgi:pyridinium-3,5-biscarboxylic acid mononucleotide sulfurtransferase